jgi:DNA-binding NarL/FixJ family response regulator
MSATIIPREEASAEETSPSKPIRIVIADDHPIFRDGLKHLLATVKEFEVVGEAGHGDDVLPAVEKYQPDILLLDLKMPGTHGLAVLQKMQAAQSTTKVIVLTASEDKNEFVQAMKLALQASC